jgi:hypothetical protein
VKAVSGHPSAREYVTGLTANGRYHFASREAQSALGVSAAGLAVNRLASRGRSQSGGNGSVSLAELIDPEKLAAAGRTAPVPQSRAKILKPIQFLLETLVPGVGVEPT